MIDWASQICYCMDAHSIIMECLCCWYSAAYWTVECSDVDDTACTVEAILSC